MLVRLTSDAGQSLELHTYRYVTTPDGTTRPAEYQPPMSSANRTPTYVWTDVYQPVRSFTIDGTQVVIREDIRHHSVSLRLHAPDKAVRLATTSGPCRG